jgi:putative solute:sodium symporter small subunit
MKRPGRRHPPQPPGFSGKLPVSRKISMTNKPQKPHSARNYWRANLRLVAVCLVIWFIASYGFGILLVEPLNKIQFFGFKLGFWFAQQGSIVVFLLLIIWYAWRMNRLDREYGVNESEETETGA